MKKILILLLPVILLACHSHPVKPVLYIPQSAIDLSTIPFDSTYTLQYKLLNRGDGELVIDTATASCGCTQPRLLKQRLLPMDSGMLVVQYKPVDTGQFDKKVVIKTNTAEGFSVVEFKGRVVRR